MRRAIALLLLSVVSLLAQTDFAPHDLASATSHSPYKLTGSSHHVSGYHPWRVLDGTETEWIGALAGVEWLQLELDVLPEIVPHDLTSNTSHSPIVVTSSTELGAGYGAWRTLDGVIDVLGEWWIGTNAGVEWIKYDLGEGNAKILGSYEIHGADHSWGAGRNPRDWTIQGSDDDSTWNTISTVTGQTAWWSEGESRSFACSPVTTAYRYFKIVITANTGDAAYTQIDQVYFYELGATNSGQKLAGSYAIKASNPGTFYPDRGPHDWTLQGSNDKGTWTTLDTVTGEASWTAAETRTYTCDTVTTAYQFFRLNITANNGDATYTEIGELYMYEGTLSSIKAVSTVPLAGIGKITGELMTTHVKKVAGVANQ